MNVGVAQPRARLLRALSVVALLGLLAYFAIGVVRPLVRPYAYSDFVTFYSAAQAFSDSRTPYDLEELRAADTQFEGWVGRYFYPPPFAALWVRPLLGLPFDTARRLWVLVEAAAYLGAAVLLARLAFGNPRPAHAAAVAALFLAFAPFQLDLRLGSVSGILLLLVSIFLLNYARERHTRAALALAAAILLKLAPAVVLGYAALRGEWRLVRRTLTAVVVLVLVALPWTGVAAYGDYLTGVLPFLASANFSWFTNQSVDAFFWRLLVPNPDTTPWLDSPALYRGASAVVCAVILVALAVVARRRRRHPRDVAGMALALLSSLLLARVTWEYMLVLTLPGFVLWLRAAWERTVPRNALLALAAAFALCAAPIPYTAEPLRSGAGLLLEAPRLYGMLLAFGTGVALALREANALRSRHSGVGFSAATRADA